VGKLGSTPETAVGPGQKASKDWFDWAETYVADRKLSEAKWHNLFSPSAERVLKLAAQAAASLRHDAVGAEHLLAGVLKFNLGSAAAALKQAGLNLPVLRQEIESVLGVSEQKQIEAPIPYTARSKRIIERAQDRVRGLEGAHIEVEDLLLELLAEDEGLPAQIFRKRSIDVETIKRAVTRKANQ
jgi:ATP-dependent Clp protease ATP-binding subunit ClpC